ncbi:MAG: phosphoglycerate kinase [Dehalococcoidia bacterium]
MDYLIKNNIKTILISHLGRPKGIKNNKFSLNQILPSIEKHLGYKTHIFEFDDPGIHKKINNLNPKELILIDNIRFYKDEEEYSESFSENLSSLADCYVNDAFAVSHRNHSSITGLPKYLPSYMGYKMYDEYTSINNKNEQYNNSTAIFGGSKIEDKILILQNFIGKVKTIIIGGGMISEFTKTTKNTIEPKLINYVLNNTKTEIVLPDDVLVKNDIGYKYLDTTELSEIDSIVDIGPKSILKYTKIINKSDYILWNGPMGIFEDQVTNIGTSSIVESIQENKSAYTVVGGGSTLQSINEFGHTSNFSHVSTGGGAFMEYIENGSLPGIQVIINNKLN